MKFKFMMIIFSVFSLRYEAELRHMHQPVPCRRCRCVLRMDHHCPFTSNCVGAANYHHFFLFTFWLTWGSAYVAIASCLWHGPRFSNRSISLRGYQGIFVACVISGAVFCGLLVLLTWHCVVALSGYGTLELLDR